MTATQIWYAHAHTQTVFCFICPFEVPNRMIFSSHAYHERQFFMHLNIVKYKKKSYSNFAGMYHVIRKSESYYHFHIHVKIVLSPD